MFHLLLFIVYNVKTQESFELWKKDQSNTRKYHSRSIKSPSHMAFHDLEMQIVFHPRFCKKPTFSQLKVAEYFPKPRGYICSSGLRWWELCKVRGVEPASFREGKSEVEFGGKHRSQRLKSFPSSWLRYRIVKPGCIDGHVPRRTLPLWTPPPKPSAPANRPAELPQSLSPL